MEALTASLEDYLEIIWNYVSDKGAIRAVDIAKELKISRASVTEALKKLSARGYVNYEKYDSLSLTVKGLEVAKRVALKHKTLEKFFNQILGLSEEESAINACRIEHVITPNAFERISEVVSSRCDGGNL